VWRDEPLFDQANDQGLAHREERIATRASSATSSRSRPGDISVCHRCRNTVSGVRFLRRGKHWARTGAQPRMIRVTPAASPTPAASQHWRRPQHRRYPNTGGVPRQRLPNTGGVPNTGGIPNTGGVPETGGLPNTGAAGVAEAPRPRRHSQHCGVPSTGGVPPTGEHRPHRPRRNQNLPGTATGHYQMET